ncbi:MAG: hypothetical protein ACYSWO_30975 [Planctomycetota bacterium]|jgi:hypothetical protein
MNQAKITAMWLRVANGEPIEHNYKYRSDYASAQDRLITTHFCRPGEPCRIPDTYNPGDTKGTGRRMNAINLYSRNV